MHPSPTLRLFHSTSAVPPPPFAQYTPALQAPRRIYSCFALPLCDVFEGCPVGRGPVLGRGGCDYGGD